MVSVEGFFDNREDILGMNRDITFFEYRHTFNH